jgi:hypothetical protein
MKIRILKDRQNKGQSENTIKWKKKKEKRQIIYKALHRKPSFQQTRTPQKRK